MKRWWWYEESGVMARRQLYKDDRTMERERDPGGWELFPCM
jgi:hypothetical protein